MLVRTHSVHLMRGRAMLAVVVNVRVEGLRSEVR